MPDPVHKPEKQEPKREIVAERGDDGKRLDQVLAARIPDLSRRAARVVIDIGGVFVDGVRTKMAGRLVRDGQRISVHLGGAFDRATKRVGQQARAADAAELPRYEIVFEDEDLVVVDKPPGLLTAPTPESDRGNLADLLARRDPERRAPIFVGHRIDLPTSGLLVFAKTPLANRALSERFRVHDVVREYQAIVLGRFPDAVTTIDRNIEGRRAVTHVTVEERFGDRATLIRCRLETGRTHQIRIHCRGVRHPVLGDPQLGVPPGLPRAPRMALHAAKLGFVHPATGEAKLFERPLPSDLEGYVTSLREASP
jgi:23S rRNA pseudouridine1911/1915/1917 synthase